MTNNKKLLFGCAMALSAFDAYSMSEKNHKNKQQTPNELQQEETSNKNAINQIPGKFDSLRILFNQLGYLPRMKKSLVQQLYKNRPFVLSSPEHNLSLTIPAKKLRISGYFNALFNNDTQSIVESEQLKQYGFDSEISKEAILLLTSYVKYYGTEQEESAEHDILKSDYIIEIYRLADKLCITPLITFLNHNIIDTLIESGFIKNLVDEVGEEGLEEALDNYLYGNLDHILETCADPRYFDWNNPIIFKHQDLLTSISFSPDNTYFATTSNDSTCNIYNIKTKELITLKQDSQAIGVQFTPDSNHVIITSRHTVQIYSLKHHKIINNLSKDTTSGLSSISNNGRYVSTYLDTILYVYDMDKDTIETIQNKDPINSITFDPNSRFILIGDDRGLCTLFDLINKKTTSFVKCKDYIRSLIISPDSNYCATTIGNVGITDLYDLNTKEIIAHNIGNNFVAFFIEQGRYLVGKPRYDTLTIYDCNTGKIRSIEHQHDINKVELSQNNTLVAIVAKDCCKIYNFESCQPVMIIENHGGTCDTKINYALFNRSNRFIITTSNDGTCKIGDIFTQKIITAFDAGGGGLDKITISNNGQCIAIKCNNTCYLFMMHTKETMIKKIIKEGTLNK